MKLELKFYVENGFIPIDYRPYFMSYLKASVSKQYKDIFDELYDKNNIKSKSFTFAITFKKSKILKDRIECDDKILTMILTSHDQSLILFLYNSFIKRKNKFKRFNDDFIVKLEKVFLSPHSLISENSVNIRFLSPLLVRVHDEQNNIDDYILYSNKLFNTQLNKSVKQMLEDNSIDVKNDDININLKPIRAKTTVIKHMNKYFNANIGEFLLSGNKEILNILQKTGLGSRRGQGFGMFYVINKK